MWHPGTLHGAGSVPALCMAPGAAEKAIGAPWSMLIGACVSGRKLGPVTSMGAAALVLCARSS